MRNAKMVLYYAFLYLYAFACIFLASYIYAQYTETTGVIWIILIYPCVGLLSVTFFCLSLAALAFLKGCVIRTEGGV